MLRFRSTGDNNKWFKLTSLHNSVDAVTERHAVRQKKTSGHKRSYKPEAIITYHFLDFNRGGGFLGIRKSALMGCMSQSAGGKKTTVNRNMETLA